MYLHQGTDYAARASILVSQLINDHDPKYGVGSLTCSVYDTAWVALVIKDVDGQKKWLFPSSFEYLLSNQQHDGGWQTSSSDADGILNTLAALLAFCRHIDYPLQLTPPEDLRHKKDRAIYFLETKFSKCDIESTINANLQPFFSRLLQMLEQEGIHFSFSGKDVLTNERGRKMPHQNLAALYSNIRTSAAHNLESRAGEVDFNRVGQHKICGSMMASPAATAAYLMGCTSWDDEAEAYLHHIVSIGDNRSAGGVPSKFPTTVFEVTRVLSTLLDNGFTPQDLGPQALDNAAGFLHDCLQLESGVTGFAPYVESDADNTAQAISALCLLGRNVSPQGLMVRYELREGFKTCTHDRNPSFRTNCHVLQSLLDLLPGNNQQISQIEKCIRFICNTWWTTNGLVEDQSVSGRTSSNSQEADCVQQNISSNYPVMLMASAFMRLIRIWEQGFIPIPDDSSIRDKVVISLFQALTRILQSQNTDGSWESGPRCESTAYAVITLVKLASFSSAPRVKMQAMLAIKSGREYLSKNYLPFSEPELMWTGKTTSGSGTLHQAYILAALQAPIPKLPSGPTIESHFEIPLAKVTIQTKYYGRQAWFANTPEWLIQASLIEGHLFLPQIRDLRYAVFPSDNAVEDQHFDYIPFMWIATNNIEKRLIGAEFLYQMMILSVLNRQFDEYMEHVVGEVFAGCVFEIEDIIQSIFQELEMYSKDQCFCGDHNETSRSSTATTISDVRSVLYRFISHILNHPYVLMASTHDQAQLICELQSFLLGPVSQLSSRGHTEGLQPAKTPTDQTAHPYNFAFFTCIVGNQGPGGGVGLRKEFLETPEQQFLAADLIRHVSIISFMSRNNDEQQATVPPTQAKSRSPSFGSSRRSLDRSVSSTSMASSYYGEEGFSPISPISSVSSASSGSPKASTFSGRSFSRPFQSTSTSSKQSLQLTRLLRHERRSLKVCLDSLREAGVDRPTANVLKLFVDFTELSEQIYSDSNIGSCFQPTTANEVIEQACTIRPPPVPSKPDSQKGSVAAARAAIAIPPLITKAKSRPQSFVEGAPVLPDLFPPLPARNSSRPPSFDQGDDRTLTPGQDESLASAVPIERDWSWNKPIVPRRRTSRASVEVSRIERIMSDMESIKIQPKHRPESQRQTTSESDAGCVQEKPKIDAQKRLAAATDFDPEAVKLAKTRLETQKYKSLQPQQRAVTDLHKAAKEHAETRKKPAVELQNRATAEINKQDVKRRATEPADGGWLKSPPSAEMVDSQEVQARKLHRASRLGGPKWKAPF